MKDLKKYRDMPGFLESNPQFFTQYPGLINRAAHTMVVVDGATRRARSGTFAGISSKSGRGSV